MAKLIGPLHSIEARGRVGGIVYNTWRGISYAKAQSSPAQPRTQRQLQIRAWTTRLVRYWRSLSDIVRGTWDTYATSHPDIDWTNNPKRLTGLNWFVRCNLRLLDLAKPTIDDPPGLVAPNPLEAFAAADGAADIVVTWTPTLDWGDYVDIFLFGPASAGIAAKIQRASHNVYAGGPAGSITISDVLPGTYTLWARVIYQDTGLASTWVSDKCLIT